MTIPGLWCWFTNPVSVFYNNKLYFIPIDTVGLNYTVHQYDIMQETVNSKNLATSYSSDDHGNGSILVRNSDKKIIVFGAKHTDDTIRMWVSTEAESISAFGNEVSLDSQIGGNTYAYPCPIQLTGEANEPIYLFYRNRIGLQSIWDGQHYSISADGGSTWSTGVKFFSYTAGENEQRPYFHYAQNGTDRVDFLCTDGHPNEVATNSVYHFYLTGGKWYKSDGTEITGDLPLTPDRVTKVYDGTTIRAWVWDIAVNSSGNPVIVFSTFPNSTNDHRYNYAVWTGTDWSIHEICTAGGYLYAAEKYYSGGVTIDKGNPSIVWCSRNIDSKWSIWRYMTIDSGATWSGSEQSSPTTDIQARPYCAKGATNDEPIWWYGTYITYENADCLVHYPSAISGRLISQQMSGGMQNLSGGFNG